MLFIYDNETGNMETTTAYAKHAIPYQTRVCLLELTPTNRRMLSYLRGLVIDTYSYLTRSDYD